MICRIFFGFGHSVVDDYHDYGIGNLCLLGCELIVEYFPLVNEFNILVLGLVVFT